MLSKVPTGSKIQWLYEAVPLPLETKMFIKESLNSLFKKEIED